MIVFWIIVIGIIAFFIYAIYSINRNFNEINRLYRIRKFQETIHDPDIPLEVKRFIIDANRE